MGRETRRFINDCALWAFCLVIVGFLTRAGVIGNAGIALGGAALWFGLRAHSRDVNTVHKNKIVEE